jgi:holin-like protein
MLKGLMILLSFQVLGEAIKAYTGIILPGPIIGMLLLFIGLCLWRGVPSFLNQSSQTLIQYLALMFLPPSVGLFFLGERFDDQWPAIISAMIIGTFLSLVFSALLMKWLMRKSS